jgi:hypothetical protein
MDSEEAINPNLVIEYLGRQCNYTNQILSFQVVPYV